MDFSFSPEEQALLKDVRAFLQSETTPELLAETQELGFIYGERRAVNSSRNLRRTDG